MTISIRLTPEEACLIDFEDAFTVDTAIEAFEARGRQSRPLSALKTETQ